MNPAVSRSWQPLLEGASAARARSIIDDVAAALLEPPATPAAIEPSLAGGAAGRAVFFAYLNVAQPERDWDAQIERHLGDAVAALGEQTLADELYGGFTGVAWAAQHIEGRFLDADGEDPNAALDEALLGRLLRAPWQGHFDLISGLAGFGVYGLERMARPLGRRCLEAVVARLDELSRPRAGGLAWLSEPRFMAPHQAAHHPRGHFNLGVAHGMPAVAVVLAGAAAAGIARAQPLLDGVMRYLLEQRQPTGASAYAYSDYDGERPDPARAAWCYGDPGVAASLLAAARAVARADWAEAALAVGRRAAVRAMDDCGVRDAGLCHGAAGLGLLFHRLWQEAPEPLFADAARRWYERAIAMHEPGRGVAGYRSYHPGEGDAWRDDAGLLTGANGVALALLAATTTVEPAWDRLLAASLPPT